MNRIRIGKWIFTLKLLHCARAVQFYTISKLSIDTDVLAKVIHQRRYSLYTKLSILVLFLINSHCICEKFSIFDIILLSET